MQFAPPKFPPAPSADETAACRRRSRRAIRAPILNFQIGEETIRGQSRALRASRQRRRCRRAQKLLRWQSPKMIRGFLMPKIFIAELSFAIII